MGRYDWIVEKLELVRDCALALQQTGLLPWKEIGKIVWSDDTKRGVGGEGGRDLLYLSTYSGNFCSSCAIRLTSR